MATSRMRSAVGATLATIASSLVVVGVGQAPAFATVTGVRGEAYGYYSNVSFFGGPYTLLGYGQPAGSPAIAATPSVALARTGGTTTLTDPDGSMAQYGPATIFGWYNASTGTYGSSGAETVYASGSIGASGSVTSYSRIVNAGPGPVVMPQVVTTCNANQSATSGSVSVSNGYVETSTDANGTVTSTAPIPSSPAPGYRINGTINSVGDRFHVVFNEQTLNADGSRKTIGAHLYLDGPTAVGDLVVAVATCGVTR